MDNYQARILYLSLRDSVEELAPECHYSVLTQYEDLCREYNHVPEEPLCKIRLAKYFRGQYNMRFGRYIQAESAFLEALYTDAPEETLRSLSDAQIKYELLLAYEAENKTTELLVILRELLDLISDERHGHTLEPQEQLFVYSLCNEYYESMWKDDSGGYLRRLKQTLWEVCQDFMQDIQFVDEYCEAISAFVCTSALLLAEYGRASNREYRACWEILSQIHDMSHLSIGTRVLVLRTMIRIAYELRYPAEAYVEEIVALAGNRELTADAKSEVYQMAASFYCGAGQYDKGRKCLQYALDKITQEWHFDIRYFDQRAYQKLEPAQQNFQGCYDTIRKYADKAFAYESVLQFKALASLAGRERNRMLYSGRIDRRQLSEIHELQDRIAWQETAGILRKQSVECGNNTLMLRRLEAELEEKCPPDGSFIDITLEKVKEVLPDQSAVVEYLFYETDGEKHEFSSCDRGTAIDIYVLCKKTKFVLWKGGRAQMGEKFRCRRGNLFPRCHSPKGPPCSREST